MNTRANTSATGRLDEGAVEVLDWLLDVCRKSERSYDQVFIVREFSRITRLFTRDKRAEIKALGMSDLRITRSIHVRALRRAGLIATTRGRWPGMWFVVRVDGAGGREASSDR